MSKFVLTAQVQLQAPTNTRQVVNQIQKQLQGVSLNLNVQGGKQTQQQINNITKATKQATTAATGLGKTLQTSIRRYAGLAIATRAVSLFTNTLSSAIKEAIDFERELIKVVQVTGRTVQQLKGLTSEITRLSTAFGASSTSLISVSRILSQAGLSANETKVALDALARSTLAPTFDNITQTAEGAVAIFNQFRQGAAALEQQLGAINAVAGKFAVEAGDLIAVIRRTGGVFRAAGGDLNELIALFTSVRATTRESAESIATGLRTIFTRIQRPRTINFLKEFGVELVDLNGKFVGPFEAIKRLSQALSGLEQGDLGFIRIAEELGGFRQIGKVIPLIQEFSVAQSALNTAMAGSDSLTKDAATAQQALAVRIARTKEQFVALIREITGTRSFQIMANSALNIASAFLKVADAIKPLIPLIAAFATIKLAKGLGGALGGARSALGFNRGGSVPGSGNSDTVPAMLSPGEFVIRKSAVQAFGASNLSSINKYGAGEKVKQNLQGINKQSVNYKDVTNNPEISRSAQGSISGVMFERMIRRRIGAGAGTDAYPDFPTLSKKQQKMLRISNPRAEAKWRKGGGTGDANTSIIYAKMNKGGGVGAGTDTVPALLTPGEFVVNKKSAQSFGYGNLSKVNKYARGGPVGSVQKFASGGKAEGGFSAGLGFTLALGAVQAMIPAIDENSTAFQKNTNTLLSFGTQIFATIAALEMLASQAGASSILGLFGKETRLKAGDMARRGTTNKLLKMGNSEGMVGKGLRMGGFTPEMANKLGEGVGVLTVGATKLAQAFGIAATAAGAVYAAFELFKKLSGATERLTNSIEDGNVSGAEAAAVEGAGFDQMGTVLAGAVGGAAAGLMFGPIGVAIGASLGVFLGTLLAPSTEIVRSQAAAQAQAASTAKVLAKANKEAAESAQEYKKGNISLSEFLEPAAKAAQSAGEANKRGKEAVKESEASSANLSGAGQLRQMFGFEKTTAQVKREERKAQEGRDIQVTKIAMPAVQSQARAQAASGGDFAGFFASLDPAIRASFDRAGVSLQDVFESIQKDVERARKQFALLNLGLTNVNAAADASILALNSLGNFTDLAANNSIDNALATLEGGLTAAGAALDPNVFSKAVDTGSQALRDLGASDSQVNKFRESTKGINAAQKSVPAVIANLKKQFDPKTNGPLNPQELKSAFAGQIAKDMKGVMSDDQIGNLQSLIQDADLEQGDIDSLQRGDFSPLQKLVDQFGDESLKEFTDAMKKSAEIQNKMASILKKRIDLENQLAESQSKVIAVQLEAAEIISKAGGPAVTSKQREQSLIAQSNASTGNLGLRNLDTGSAGEIRFRNQELKDRANSIQKTRLNVAGGGSIGAKEGTALQGEQDRLNAAIKEQADLTRALISAKQQELQIIKAKNSEEKKGLEALMGGDFEAFFDSRATVGATAAAAIGDQGLMQSFGQAGMAGAVSNLQNMQSQGVNQVFGQSIGGQGGVLEGAASGALSRFGMSGSAGIVAGTTSEENAVNSEIIALAKTLPETAQLEADAAQRMVDAANVQMQAAETQLEAVKQRLTAAGYASGGVVYANKGMFVPRGTDTVPAMLTPGEFVVKRSAVQSGNNLAMLKSMNNGSSAAPTQGMSRGGQVRYMNNGGGVGGGGGGMGISPEVLNSFSSSLRDFNTQLSNNITSLQNTQFQIKLDTTNINVNLTGTSFINNLTATIKQDIMAYVSDAIGKYKVGSDGSLTQDGMKV